MARTPRTRAAVQAKFQQDQPPPSPRRRRRRGAKRNGLDRQEVESTVCKEFCNGRTVAEIVKIVEEKHGVRLRREEPYQLLSYAASNGRLRYLPPYEYELETAIKEDHGWLELKVVHTAVFDHVAYRAAEMLIRLLQQCARVKDEVHLGWAGGHSMRKVARTFADLLRRPIKGLPETIVFHALVAGFDVNEPSTAPNAFFTHFSHDTAIQVNTKFVGLHAPAMVHTDQFDGLRELHAIEDAYASAKDLDVIITSASLWSDEHSMLLQYMSKCPDSLKALKKANCRGDMLWRPLGPDGPIEIETEIRAMTLLELSDLPQFIHDGKHVLLVLGPCGACNTPKGGLLDIVLKAHDPLLTHLVVDSRAAREFLSMNGQAA